MSGNYPFLLNSFLELSIRAKESIIIPYSINEINDIFSKISKALFYSQNNIFRQRDSLKDFGILYSLWEFEEQEDIFIKLYRYNYFFKFKNNEIDLESIFNKKFGAIYDSFSNFCFCILAMSISLSIEQFWECFDIVDKMYPGIKDTLTIDFNEYYKNSLSLCNNIENIAYSLKISQTYPFIRRDDTIFLPLPHAILTACTKSLLYRLTLGDNKLRSLIGKNVLENYVYDIIRGSKIYEFVSKEVFLDINHEKLSPDIMCFNGNEVVGLECKLITPSVDVRFLDKIALAEHKKCVVDFVCQLYKSLFVNYSIEGNNLKFIEKENRYGIVLLFERMDFDHRSIIAEAGNTLGLNGKEREFLSKHIRFDALYDFESFVFSGGNAIDEMKKMIEKNEMYNFTISRHSCSENYVHEDFLRQKNSLCSLKHNKFMTKLK